MKRMLWFYVFAFLAVTSLFAQEIAKDSVIVTTGGTPMQFLERNMWSLIFIVYSVLSEWLGSTGKVKEGSVYAWILNVIGKIFRQKADIIKTKKAEFMSVDEIKKVKGFYE